MNFKFWVKKKKEEIKNNTKKKCHIVIFTKGNINKYGYSREMNSESSIVDMWRDFYKWYFGRKQSEQFVIFYKNGADMIKRENIVSFRIFIEEATNET